MVPVSGRVRDLSIRKKLTLISMVTSGIALFVAAAVLTGVHIYNYRRTMSADLETLARVVASNTAGAVAFMDEKVASDVLDGLAAKENVTVACIYDTSGKMFARYTRSGFACPTDAPSAGINFAAGRLSVGEPIAEASNVLGMLYVEGSLEALNVFILAVVGHRGHRVRPFRRRGVRAVGHDPGHHRQADSASR